MHKHRRLPRRHRHRNRQRRRHRRHHHHHRRHRHHRHHRHYCNATLNIAATTGEELADAYQVVRALLTDRGPGDRRAASEATERIFRCCSEERRIRILKELPGEAEHHGVAPLLEPVISSVADDALISDDVRRSFIALASRHRRFAVARGKCIDELLEAFAASDITIILLKGAALAHLIYPKPALRPMIDIDVLINPADVERAVRVTSELGYSFDSEHGSRFAGRMHHLPIARATRSGYCISLEIHLDAMSPDQHDSLNFTTLTAKPMPFQRGEGRFGLALGHIDMLRHLSQHAFEPARRVRLIHLYDLWRYQSVFRDEIDWRHIQARFPEVMIVLHLIAYVFSSAAKAPENAPAGTGFGMVPLSEITAANISPFAKLSEVFSPPAWWLHGHYGIPPERSLLFCRAVRHPLTVLRWLTRRVAAGIGFSRPYRVAAILSSGS